MSLKSEEPGNSHVPKAKPVGKKRKLAEQRASSGAKKEQTKFPAAQVFGFLVCFHKVLSVNSTLAYYRVLSQNQYL